MMIEVVVCNIYLPCHCERANRSRVRLHQPFFHLIANIIADEVGESNPHAILATTIVAFAFSSILTGAGYKAQCSIFIRQQERVTDGIILIHRADFLPARSLTSGHPHRLLPTTHPCRVRLLLPSPYKRVLTLARRCIGGVGVFLVITG